MMSFRRGLNLATRILDSVLYRVLHRLMCLIWFNKVGFWTLGTNMIKVPFR